MITVIVSRPVNGWTQFVMKNGDTTSSKRVRTGPSIRTIVKSLEENAFARRWGTNMERRVYLLDEETPELKEIFSE